MTPPVTLTRAEYWLLRYVVKVQESVPSLKRRGYDFASWFNAPSHRLNRRGLVATLDRLFRWGLIEAEWLNEEGGPVPTRPEIAEALSCTYIFDERTFRYGLTPAGGACWEAAARPDWNVYLQIIGAGQGMETVTGADPEQVRRYLLSMGQDPEAVCWNTVEPWEATYWKRLPLGYQVRFDCREARRKRDERAAECEPPPEPKWGEWCTDPY